MKDSGLGCRIPTKGKEIKQKKGEEDFSESDEASQTSASLGSDAALNDVCRSHVHMYMYATQQQKHKKNTTKNNSNNNSNNKKHKGETITIIVILNACMGKML